MEAAKNVKAAREAGGLYVRSNPEIPKQAGASIVAAGTGCTASGLNTTANLKNQTASRHRDYLDLLKIGNKI